MEKNYKFIWPNDFVDKLNGIYVKMHYSFKEADFMVVEEMYKEWYKMMLLVIDAKVSDGLISLEAGIARKDEVTKLLNSASIIANLGLETSKEIKINLFYKEFEHFLSNADLSQTLDKSRGYAELTSAISILGQVAFLGAIGSAILAKNTSDKDYGDLVKILQSPYLASLVRQYNDNVVINIDSEKQSVYEAAVNKFNEHRDKLIKERLEEVYKMFGLLDYVNGGEEVLEPSIKVTDLPVEEGSIIREEIKIEEVVEEVAEIEEVIEENIEEVIVTPTEEVIEEEIVMEEVKEEVKEENTVTAEIIKEEVVPVEVKEEVIEEVKEEVVPPKATIYDTLTGMPPVEDPNPMTATTITGEEVEISSEMKEFLERLKMDVDQTHNTVVETTDSIDIKKVD